MDVGLQRIALSISAAERWVVAQLRVLIDGGNGIQTEATDAAVEPEAHHLEHRTPDTGIAPIQIRLLSVEPMVIVLIHASYVFPGRATKNTHPVVRRPRLTCAIWPSVAPEVKIMGRRMT